MKVCLSNWNCAARGRGTPQPHLLCVFLVLSLFFSFKSFAQEEVTGSVTSGDSAVVGASVQVKGGTAGTQTDVYGNFRIAASPGSTLVISSVGYVTQEVKVTASKKVSVQLLPSVARSMDEVVVVGYGTQKRGDVTGAVASVPKSRFTQIPSTNVMQAIEGSVAGVSVTTNSFVPGRTATIQIRGINSITANTSPLLVIDGIPMNVDASTNDINPNDVASMEILKDASAVAIYGVRGSNGVILITTKRGSSGKPIIRYNGYTGAEKTANPLTPLSPEAFVKKYADYLKQNNLTQTKVLPNTFEVNNYNAGKTVDWLDQTLQTGIIQDHNLSVSGGSQDVKYYLSGEYLNQKGVVKGYEYQRFSVRSNLDFNITSYLSAGASLLFTNNNYDGGRANFYLGAAMSPYGTVYNANGGYEIYPMYEELLYTNPLLGLNVDRIDRSKNLNGQAYIEIKPGGAVKGLKYRLNAGYNYVPANSGSYTGRDANNLIGSANVANSESKYWIIENILSYSKDWKAHHIDFTGLYSAQEKSYFASNTVATGFINDQLSFYNLGAGATVSAGNIFSNFFGSYYDQKNNLSQMVRINYGYDSRYLLTLTARRDGASVFGANTTKYGTFPSVGFGWNITNEGFMKDVTVINNLKLRGSYGKTGNEAIPINRTATTANTNRFPFNGISTIGVLASNLGNADLHWETTQGLNLGVDFSLLNNRISGSIDAYKTQTEDLVLQRNIPIITGYSNIYDNLGKLKNKGIEITLNTVNVITPAFRWESSINFSSYTNEIVSLYGNLDSNGNEISDLGNRWFIGHPVRVIYDYEMVGVWQEGEDPSKWDPAAKPGSLKFTDVNGDQKIDGNDRIILGSPIPKWSMGFTNTFHYKNFHLNIFIQGVHGLLRNNVNLTYADEAGRMNIPAEIGYWTPENKSQTRPGLSATAVTNTRGYGYPRDASYLRIKDVTLSYVMSQKVLDKIKLSGLTLYLSGRNLATFTDWVGWDPENDAFFRGSGDWTNNYPFVRSLTFGINVTLR